MAPKKVHKDAKHLETNRVLPSVRRSEEASYGMIQLFREIFAICVDAVLDDGIARVILD